MEGKPVKIFPSLHWLFHANKKMLHLWKELVLSFRKAKALYGMALVLFPQFQSSGVSKVHRHLNTTDRQLHLSSILMWWTLPSANSPLVTEHHHQNLTLSGTHTATSHFPRYIPAQSNHRQSLWIFPGEKTVVEKINEAKIVTDEKILVLLCEGEETSLVSPELYVFLTP